MQIKWCGQVFERSNPILLLSQLAGSTLSSLDPAPSQVISAAAKQQEDPLAFLLSIKNAGDEFLQAFQSCVGTVNDG